MNVQCAVVSIYIEMDRVIIVSLTEGSQNVLCHPRTSAFLLCLDRIDHIDNAMQQSGTVIFIEFGCGYNTDRIHMYHIDLHERLC